MGDSSAPSMIRSRKYAGNFAASGHTGLAKKEYLSRRNEAGPTKRKNLATVSREKCHPNEKPLILIPYEKRCDVSISMNVSGNRT